MKWYDVATYFPPGNGYYIVRIKDDNDNSGDIMYAGLWFEDDQWLKFEDISGIVTHFIIPDAIEHGVWHGAC